MCFRLEMAGVAARIAREEDGLGEWTREQKARALAALAIGSDDEECGALAGVSRGQWFGLKAAVLEDEGERLEGQTDREVYGEYAMRQTAILSDLKVIQKDFEDAEKPNQMAMLGCLRARSEIYDKVLKVGQDMGFVRKEPDRQEIGLSAATQGMDDSEREEWLEADRREFYRLRAPDPGPKAPPWGRTTAQLREATRGDLDDSC